jgi:multidrug resistance protein, MATE family
MAHTQDTHLSRATAGSRVSWIDQMSRNSIEIRALLRIAIPLALAELGWVAMGLADTIMVGRLPDSAVAIGATSVGNALFYGFGVFGYGLISGLDSIVSQAFGAKDLPAVRRGMAAGLTLAALAAPILISCIYAGIPLLGMIGVQPVVRVQAASFVDILVWSLPLLLLYSVFRCFLQGVHHVRPITFALVSANLVNILGNWVLIYGHWGAPAMGVRGSALSTLLARIYMAGVLFAAIRLHDPTAFRGLRVAWSEVGRLFRLGLPAAMTIGFEMGVFGTATALAGTLDPVSVAAHAIALNAASVTYMIPLGIGAAGAVSVGRAIGAGDRRAAARAGWIAIGIAAFYEVFAAISFVLFPKQIASAYTADPRVISLSGTLLGIAAVFQLFDGLQTTAGGVLRGSGDTKTALVWNLLSYWVIGLPLGYWLCFRLGWGAAGLWDGLCLALVLIGSGLLTAWARNPRTKIT